MLECGCDFIDPDEDWYEPGYETKPLNVKRSCKCISCKTKINPGDECLEVKHYRNTEPESVEERIHGDVRQLASKYLCEKCADAFFVLDERGYCIYFHENLQEQARAAGIKDLIGGWISANCDKDVADSLNEAFYYEGWEFLLGTKESILRDLREEPEKTFGDLREKDVEAMRKLADYLDGVLNQ